MRKLGLNRLLYKVCASCYFNRKTFHSCFHEPKTFYFFALKCFSTIKCGNFCIFTQVFLVIYFWVKVQHTLMQFLFTISHFFLKPTPNVLHQSYAYDLTWIKSHTMLQSSVPRILTHKSTCICCNAYAVSTPLAPVLSALMRPNFMHSVKMKADKGINI